MLHWIATTEHSMFSDTADNPYLQQFTVCKVYSSILHWMASREHSTFSDTADNPYLYSSQCTRKQ